MPKVLSCALLLLHGMKAYYVTVEALTVLRTQLFFSLNSGIWSVLQNRAGMSNSHLPYATDDGNILNVVALVPSLCRRLLAQGDLQKTAVCRL